MNGLEASLIVAGLFVARLAIPLALTLLFGLLMNRFVAGDRLD
jgi:hypothetical protein